MDNVVDTAAVREPQPRRNTRLIIGCAAAVLLLAVSAVAGYFYFNRVKATDLPFVGLRSPAGLAIDRNGTLFVADGGANRVFKLTAGSSQATELPLGDLDGPVDVAVDDAGNVYVAVTGATTGTAKILKATQGNDVVQLPTAGLRTPVSIAVDARGTLYATDWKSLSSNRLLRLSPEASSWEVLGHSGMEDPDGITIDSAGNLYATDSQTRVAKTSAPGATSWTEIVSDDVPKDTERVLLGITADGMGSVYVAGSSGPDGHPNHMRSTILRVPEGKGRPAELNYREPAFIVDVAADAQGAVYITDQVNKRVVKLEP